MVIKNNKTIGLVIFVVGLVCMAYYGNHLYQAIVYPITGTVKEATVIGYKGKGSKEVLSSNDRGNKHAWSGRSPYFQFQDANHNLVKAYSHNPSVFVFFDYTIGDKISIAYPKNKPSEAIIDHWKEYPGIVFMILFSLLLLYMGVQFMFK
jgi:hypothetical protein